MSQSSCHLCTDLPNTDLTWSQWLAHLRDLPYCRKELKECWSAHYFWGIPATIWPAQTTSCPLHRTQWWRHRPSSGILALWFGICLIRLYPKFGIAFYSDLSLSWSFQNRVAGCSSFTTTLNCHRSCTSVWLRFCLRQNHQVWLFTAPFLS